MIFQFFQNIVTKKFTIISFTILFVSLFGVSQLSAESLSLLPQRVKQTLERKPTKAVLKEETYISLYGKTEIKNKNYVGRFEGGSAYKLRQGDKERFTKILAEIKKDPNARKSLFTIEARDIKNKVLLEIPVAISKIRRGDDVPYSSYRDVGSFYMEIILPRNTNSLVLRKRNGEILDRVYVENWEPEVKILNYPRKVKSTDKFQIEIELYPKGKAYSYSLFLINAKDGSNMGMIGGSLEPKSGKITETIDLNGYPFVTSSDWLIEAVGYSLFRSKKVVSKPIFIELSSENIEVKISGKDKKIRKNGEEDLIGWSHIFYFLDVRTGLEELCKQGRCFELVWSGEGVEFSENVWEPKPLNSLTTRIRTLHCTFRGSGKQKIRLQVKENGKLIGEDIYEYTVEGGKREEKTSCYVSLY